MLDYLAARHLEHEIPARVDPPAGRAGNVKCDDLGGRARADDEVVF